MELPAFDVKQLEKLSVLQDETEPNVVAVLARGFLTRAPKRLGLMRELLDKGDAERLANEVHGFASSSGMFGLMRVRGRCKALENLVRDQGLAGAGALLADIERAFTEARPLLMTELGLQEESK